MLQAWEHTCALLVMKSGKQPTAFEAPIVGQVGTNSCNGEPISSSCMGEPIASPG